LSAYLKMWSQGEEVKKLQSALNTLGNNCGDVDGVWGPKTEAAVREFQTKQNLGIDKEGYDLALKLAAPVTKPETEHFKFEEFECPDGTPIPVEYYGNLQKLMNNLEIVRSELGNRPIIIRSGYRSPEYNAKVGGEPGSWHLQACAADIYCEGYNPNCYNVGQVAYTHFYDKNIGGVGLGSNVNVHVDVRGYRSIWWYTYKSWDSWEDHQ